MKSTQLAYQTLERLAAEAGLRVLGVSGTETLYTDAERLRAWQASGHAGEMSYMQRDPGLLSNPRKLMPEAETILAFAIRYDAPMRKNIRPGFGKVARYAWGLDYHTVLKDALKRLVSVIECEVGPIRFRIFSDAVPLLERAVAAGAGLGFVGKNTMLIRPGFGSFFFIAEVLTNLEISDVPAATSKGSCGSCVRCSNSCPTGALDVPFVLDARKCISYLTIEKRGSFELWERQALGEWLFGCDLCQECCPFNHTSMKRNEAADLVQLSAHSGSGSALELKAILAIRSEDEFRNRFGRTALDRTGREGLLRNAACVAVNTESVEALRALVTALQQDSSAVVRQHCAWAIGMLQKKHQVMTSHEVVQLRDRALNDPDQLVRSEVVNLMGEI